jgi:trans-AT polyketide synthase/acyltransferase/oxidoreductase domain-containing protein
MTVKTVFLFSGQGSQYFGMGEQWYREDPVFREVMDRLDQVVLSQLGQSLVKILYNTHQVRSQPFNRVQYSHPAIFMVQFALSQSLISQGVKPDYLLGTSLGEYVAAAVSGAVPAEILLAALLSNAQAIERHCPEGAMLAVFGSAASLCTPSFMRDYKVEVAALNSPKHFVLAADVPDIQRVRAHFAQRDIVSSVLPISYAFHSSKLDVCEQSFRAQISGINFAYPQITVISSVTGQPITTFSEDYFWRVSREEIAFSSAVQYMLNAHEADTLRFIDVGASGTLAGFVRQHMQADSKHRTFTTMTPFADNMNNYRQMVSQLKNDPVIRFEAKQPVNGDQDKFEKNLVAYVFPGQGAQKRGMGAALFEKYPKMVQLADEILGYSVKQLCLEDPEGRLNQTLYTQPALFVVSALSYLAQIETHSKLPDFAAGHSLGEYAALFAAGAVDFETGLQLVHKRAQLMSTAVPGAMSAVIGVSVRDAKNVIEKGGYTQLDLANINTPSQLVISGSKEEVRRAQVDFERAAGFKAYIPLPVGGAFHSRLMAPAQQEFEQFLKNFRFKACQYPVLSNVTARPYPSAQAINDLLSRQITHAVDWLSCIRYLWGLGVETFTELGHGNVLTGLIDKIKKESTPLLVNAQAEQDISSQIIESPLAVVTLDDQPVPAISQESISIDPAQLGSHAFRQEYGLRYAYLAGAMAQGISSEQVVIRMARAGLMGFFGTGGLKPQRVEQAIQTIQQALGAGQAYGINLLNGSYEEQNVDLCLAYKVRTVEASAYMQITQGLVRYRLSGLEQGPNGSVIIRNRVIAKLSRPEIAEAFFAPPPEKLINQLVADGKITALQASLARSIPMADDICVEADSGGHTDRGVMAVLLPAIQRQRDQAMLRNRYRKTIRVGAAGGIGTPEASTMAFMLGADFILTGSVNQCTVEAGTSEAVKNLLQKIEPQDTDYAPAGDMFEIGAKVQVVRRSVFFPARANKLYDLYRNVASIDAIDSKTAQMIQEKYFKRSFDQVYEECRHYYPAERIASADKNPKEKMAMIFKWYFGYSNRLALAGDPSNQVDYQIWCGPALGAFNQIVKGTDKEAWQNRHVDWIAQFLMEQTAELLARRMRTMLALRQPELVTSD